jgi:alpha-L-fucosidase
MIASVPTGPDYRRYARAQLDELVARYRPSLLWNDIAWPGRAREVWRIFASYYAAVPDGVVNDRWLPAVPWARLLRIAPLRALANRALARSIRRRGLEPMPPPAHCDFRTPEYTSFATIQRRKWESTRGLGNSFCWNRNEDPAAVPSVAELVASVADIVAKNGNLLLNVGPRGEDASLPEDQLARLAGLGEWLARSGEAIYGTRPWRRAEERSAEGIPLRWTCGGGAVYAILLEAPRGAALGLPVPEPGFAGRVRLLGHGPVAAHREGGSVRVSWPEEVPRREGAAFAFEGAGSHAGEALANPGWGGSGAGTPGFPSALL